jgi:AAA+ superfamily predicted ATPase
MPEATIQNVTEALMLTAVCAGASGSNPVTCNRARMASLALGCNPFADDVAGIVETVSALMTRMDRLMARHGIEASVAMVKEALSPPLRETAFVWAVEMILADREAEQSERDFLRYLARAFEIPVATASKIIDVTVIRNRAPAMCGCSEAAEGSG